MVGFLEGLGNGLDAWGRAIPSGTGGGLAAGLRGFSAGRKARRDVEAEQLMSQAIQEGKGVEDIARAVAPQNPELAFKALQEEVKSKQAENLLKYKYESGAFMNPYEKRRIEKQAETDAEIEKGLAGAERMKPAVKSAIKRAIVSAESGTGIGPIGGKLTKYGINLLPDSGRNYADIESANSQMNAFIRQRLQATGLTGRELDAVSEANAYRYTINPTDNESIIKQKIKNFQDDYMQDSAEGQPSSQNDGMQERIREAINNGYTSEEIMRFLNGT